MEDRFWKEYLMTPSGKDADIAYRFTKSMDLLKTLEAFGLVDVKVSHAGRPHDEVNIWVDGVWYDEDISVWIKRFE